MFWRAGFSLLRAEGFSCSLDVLYGGLGISKLQFLNKKMLDPDLDSMNPGPKHWKTWILKPNPHQNKKKSVQDPGV
jgi:hypothetical protein